MAIPRGFTPSQRGPALGDERPNDGARTASPVLRNVSYKETDIRLTPAGTDVSAGEGDLYDFGPVNKDSIGRYVASYQDAASATADGLGAVIAMEFNIQEASAGVFTATMVSDLEGGTATDDADDNRQTNATLQALADAALDGAGPDSQATYFVATAADVTDAAAWTAAAVLVLGNLYVLDAHAATTRVHEVQRRW